MAMVAKDNDIAYFVFTTKRLRDLVVKVEIHRRPTVVTRATWKERKNNLSVDELSWRFSSPILSRRLLVVTRAVPFFLPTF